MQQVVEGGIAEAGSVRAGRRLHLDHSRPRGAEQMGAERPRPQGTEVDHQEPRRTSWFRGPRAGVVRSGPDRTARERQEFHALV